MLFGLSKYPIPMFMEMGRIDYCFPLKIAYSSIKIRCSFSFAKNNKNKANYIFKSNSKLSHRRVASDFYHDLIFAVINLTKNFKKTTSFGSVA